MYNKLILCFLILILNVTGISAAALKSFYAHKGNELVVAWIGDTVAIVEYCHEDYKEQVFSKFDTLKLTKNGFLGTFSKIVVKKGSYFYKPGNIFLRQGIPDSSFNKMRNMGYLNYGEEQFNKSFEWTGFAFSEFSVAKWNSHFSLPIDEFREKVRFANDSLRHYYTSNKISGKFERVIVRNCRLFPNRYIDSADSLKILNIWKLCSLGDPKENRMGIFYLQYPLSIVPLIILGMDPEYVILGSGITYPVLIGIEKLIINRLHSSATYKIIFVACDKKASNCVIKVRNSIVMSDNFNYKLPFDFKKVILNR